MKITCDGCFVELDEKLMTEVEDEDGDVEFLCEVCRALEFPEDENHY